MCLAMECGRPALVNGYRRQVAHTPLTIHDCKAHGLKILVCSGIEIYPTVSELSYENPINAYNKTPPFSRKAAFL